MDWSTRGSRLTQSSRPTQSTNQPTDGIGAAPSAGHHGKGIKQLGRSSSLRLATVALLFSSTILVVALIWSVVIGRPTNESKYVDTGKMQAVFLNSGQVYFGHITSLNEQYVRVNDIYYLRVNQQVQPGQANQQAQQEISLAKLGCELHGPADEMVINREQVSFWENLKDDGKVAKAVAEFKKQNPSGQEDCNKPADTTSSTAPAPAPTTPTPAATTPPATTPSTRPPTTTPAPNNTTR